ncbi:MAG: formate--tetrahydrofolate ligase, partial [Bryobacteraceae bacterium]
DIVMPSAGIKPSAAVLIATVRALEAQGGYSNLARHLENLAKFDIPVVVAVNRFASDTDSNIAAVRDFCRRSGFESAEVDVYGKGGAGGLDLAEKVIAAADAADPERVHPLYQPELSIETKVDTVAREIYGARGVYFEGAARKKIQKLGELGFGRLPVCMAKTQSSLSDNPKLTGRPENWTLTVTDAHLAAGAGFIVVVAGNMLLMPGLGKVPHAVKIDVDDEGRVLNLE